MTIRVDQRVADNPLFKVLGKDQDQDETFNTLQKYLAHERFEEILIYYEKAKSTGKMHYQGYVKIPEEHKKWMQHRWNEFFTASQYPKGTKSTAEIRKETYKIYITKGKNVAFVRNVTEERIKELEEQSYEIVAKPQKPQFQDTFYDYILEQQDVRQHISDVQWVARILCRFMSLATRPVKFMNYYKSLCYNVQFKAQRELGIFVESVVDHERYDAINAENRFVRELFY